MSVIVYCSDTACLNKVLVDSEDDVYRMLGWSKHAHDCCDVVLYSCDSHSWEAKE